MEDTPQVKSPIDYYSKRVRELVKDIPTDSTETPDSPNQLQVASLLHNMLGTIDEGEQWFEVSTDAASEVSIQSAIELSGKKWKVNNFPPFVNKNIPGSKPFPARTRFALDLQQNPTNT